MDWRSHEKLRILTKDNQVVSYTYTPGANLQPVIDLFVKETKLPILELYIQKKENAPMDVVTHLYDIHE